MKICFINSDYDIPLLGHEGCSIHVRELTYGFTEAGHQAFVVCSNMGAGHAMPGGIPAHVIEPRGMEAAHWAALEADPIVQTHNLGRDLRSLFFNNWLLEQGTELLAREKPDFIYERHALFNGAAWKLSRRFGIPLVVEVNAPMCDEQAGYDQFPLIETARKIEFDVLSRADAVVVVSSWLKEWMVKGGVEASRVHVIPNAVAGRLFEGPARTGAAVRAQHNLTGHPLIGFIGSFQSWHDVVGLVEAFDIVQHQKPEARLLLVGDGPDRPAILAKVKALKLEDKIIFAGKVDHERVPEYLAAFDVAAAPFRQVWNYQYGSPLKLFEYMGAGKPTVAAGIGQVKEVVDHERTGLLYPPQDIQALSTLLLKTLNDPVWAATLGAAARTQVLTRHTWRRVAEQIIGIAGRK